jgi:hypothetical protein
VGRRPGHGAGGCGAARGWPLGTRAAPVESRAPCPDQTLTPAPTAATPLFPAPCPPCPPPQPQPSSVAAVEIARKVTGYAFIRPAREVGGGGA